MGDCATVRPALAELAIGALGGDERAEALRHVASCAACARELERLAGVADGLLLLAPPVEPPAGFESAVLARTTGPPNEPVPGETAVAAPVRAHPQRLPQA
ncbi:hypothetical protein, partial [Asanoa sp. NPDC050611]|uniref:hypothetical protein n=1 Tax=Asanoa sp. NPDC050611 TaxID=3157098 RepID=UPI0033D29B6F